MGRSALGRYLRGRCNELGISLAELSRRTGMSRQTLHAIGLPQNEGGRLPEIDTVVKLAVELAVHPLQLFHLVFEDYRLPSKFEREHRERGDRSIFLADVTIPDGTVVAPGARFTKTWQVQNVGTVPWEGRILRCMDDELFVSRRNAFGEAEPILVTDRLRPLTPSIAVPYTEPGGIVEMSVDFKAPLLPGTCVSYWKSFLPDGTLCFPESVGLTCKVRVLSMLAAASRGDSPHLDSSLRAVAASGHAAIAAEHRSRVGLGQSPPAGADDHRSGLGHRATKDR